MPIRFDHVSHTYSTGTPYEYHALRDISLSIREGKMTAIIGQTGSGKSTLVQHLNALLLPDEGVVTVLDREIRGGEKPKKLKSLRGDVGLVFQFPEYQLFEETILKDVSFGPKNFGCSQEEAEKRARAALVRVGIPESYAERSPLELSGGQKRRVAIAGILAMDPKILVLDEPTAGLDPAGTAEMMSLFASLNQDSGKTVLMVTHDMENVYSYCDDVIVLHDGQVKVQKPVDEFFADSKICKEMSILPPAILRMKDLLHDHGIVVPKSVTDMDGLADFIVKEVKNHG